MRAQEEARARSALARFLESGAIAQQTFVRALPCKIPASGIFEVEQEHRTDHGKRIDILLRYGTTALILELKINHRENPFQYIGYRRYAERQGWLPIIIGISPTSTRSNGREALNVAINEELTEARITWGSLAAGLGNSTAAKEFRAALRDISLKLLVNKPLTPRQSVKALDIALVDREPAHLAKFFTEVIRTLPDDLTAYPDQGGTSPPLLRFGRSQWADIIGDNDRERLYLEVDRPRHSKPLPETQFHFGFTLWNNSTAGTANHPDVLRLLAIAKKLAALGFTFQRNRPFKYKPEAWRPSLGLELAGFRYLNASDSNNFLLPRSAAMTIGTFNTMARLAKEASRLVQLADKVICS